MERLPEAWRVVDAIDAETAPPGNSPSSDRRRNLTAAAVVGLIAVGALLLWGGPQGGAPQVARGEATAPGDGGGIARASTSGSAASGGAELVVDVAGGVVRPGLYRLPAGSRVGDAIAAAGGYGTRVDAAAVAATINLAELLTDGTKVLVPQLGDASSGTLQGACSPAATDSTGAGATVIDLNMATLAELDTLPGVGPVTARKIIAARESQPFRAVDDLLARKLVGATVFAKLRDLVRVGP